ncbi:hypothetical protein RHMOL_Rhmol11G0087000 [Rhododendron molle]|uniref:Uncharacterized protein n=1 Tax=Rhododendron molle TaxID=49168 RepID=A0ACC0LR04_RHOML|nr:hypothetical protein RHMOL_Rhmol11G0087000 [Rhododendron molle]
MSVASNMFEDSNAERDFKYGDGEFFTNPEISFTPSTPSEANPQRGMEAESKFRSGAEASTSAQSEHDVGVGEDRQVADLYKKAQVCPHTHFLNGYPEEYRNFCRVYGIPDNVVISRVTSDQIKDKADNKPEHITVL